MTALKVLHVDSGREWRGGQRQVFLLAQGLRERGHSPIVFAPPDSPLLEKSKSSGLLAESIVIRYDWDIRASLLIREYVRQSRVDIIHAHDARSHAVARVSLIGLSHPPLVVTRRVPFAPKAARLKYGNRVTRFIAVSTAVKTAMVDAGIEPTRIVVVHSGVEQPPSNLQPRDWRTELSWPPDAVVCGVVGAMTPEKGVGELEGIAASLSETSRKQTRILLLGGAKRGRMTIAGVEAYSAGFVEDIIPAVAGLDVLWHPSRAEGLGTSVIDAMAVGVPPVAFAVGGLSEVVVNHTSGLLVSPGNTTAFAEAAEQLICNPGLRASLGEQATGRAATFSAAKMTQQTEKVYYELLSRSGNRSEPSILRGTSA
ncbi:MAG TPA: glycosyltransferase family 4 protein [Gemmatimonadaceae bacterium]|nr:glycosyltransferase family 4 protein [Gemmatimonadaceae bacterium]